MTYITTTPEQEAAKEQFKQQAEQHRQAVKDAKKEQK
jgi:hypothetical protein